MELQFHVEKGRVLVPVGIPCPFGCKYCFTRSGEVGPPRVRPEIIAQRFHDFALANYDAIDTIQVGYDSDPFAFPVRGIELLHNLSTLGKHLNVSTKACIEGEALKGLTEVRAHLASHLVLSALVSLSCWESAPLVEPHTPTPVQRMKTIRNLKRIGVPSLVAVCPVLPHIADAEYERIFDEAIGAGCEGFLFGPLYADAEERFVRFVPKEALSKTPGRRVVVPWSAHAPHWTRYEDEPRMLRLATLAQEKRKHVFWSSAPAVEHLIHHMLPAHGKQRREKEERTWQRMDIS
jgi:DNA repair photolyase